MLILLSENAVLPLRCGGWKSLLIGLEKLRGKEEYLKYAGLAQLVEQLICNQQVAGSSPIASSKDALN